jgi:hypothetical protein
MDDSEHPAVQAGTDRELFATGQGTFTGCLNKIVRVKLIRCKGVGKSSQSGQQVNQLLSKRICFVGIERY